MGTVADKWSENESLERIYRMLTGEAVPDDVAEGTWGQEAKNVSLARIAQILEGRLSFDPPAAIIATDAEMQAGTSDTKLVTPDKLSDVCKYGGIYTWTGTMTFTGMPASWTKITGAFQNSMEKYDGDITCQPTSSRILINDVGTYMVEWSMSYIGSPDVIYKIEPYCWVGMPQAAAQSKPSASGTVTCMAGAGLARVSGTAVEVALYLLPDTASVWFIPQTFQVSIHRVGKYPE